MKRKASENVNKGNHPPTPLFSQANRQKEKLVSPRRDTIPSAEIKQSLRGGNALPPR